MTGGRDGSGVDLERIGDAIATWSANLERDPADFIAAVNLSTLYLERGHLTSNAGDLDAALAAIEQAIETDPSLPAPRAPAHPGPARLARIRRCGEGRHSLPH